MSEIPGNKKSMLERRRKDKAERKRARRQGKACKPCIPGASGSDTRHGYDVSP
jgi:hypothetical protein